LLQRQLGLSCYETAWMMLHKLRRAMVNVAREPLHSEVEVDETWVGGEQAGLRRSRHLKGRRAALVLVAVEKARPWLRARPDESDPRFQGQDHRPVPQPERLSRFDHLHGWPKELRRSHGGWIQTCRPHSTAAIRTT